MRIPASSLAAGPYRSGSVVEGGPPPHRRVLVISHQHERFHALSANAEIVASACEALSRLAGCPAAYVAVVAPVRAADGRETGYRLAWTMRRELGIACPIMLFSNWVTASARAYAMQCGATRLLVDDMHLVDDLIDMLAVADAASV